ncbi:copper resistance CopC family protein [Brachybacterium hainanense]|uniref:Copper resistance protein CopC n=1 Tax=Brachybacterium hainanense TaxID=1541174 RepID=A0ABV6RIT1_9MICO
MSTANLSVFRRLLAALGLAVLVLAALLGVASPALAHDHLVSSDPADGAQLETSPEQITLTYSAELMDVSPLVRILDGTGETVLEQAPTIEGITATVPLEEPLIAGDYTVQWRVVSSDGHPIEDSFTFSVAEGAGAPATGGPDAEDPASAEATTAAPEQTSAPAATPEPASTDTSNALLPVFVGIGAIVVIGVVIALRAGRRDPNGPSGQH